MTDRTVRVRLLAEATGYIQGVEAARKKTSELGSEAEKLAAKRESFTQLGQGALAVGTLAAVGVGAAVASFSTFDAAMSNVQATTHETSANMGLLRQAALDAGAQTVFSATESANAIDELGKSGMSTADILAGGLTGSLSLASAGSLGVARAAEITSITLEQFNLRGDQASRVADVLAAGAGKAMGSVDDLAQALKFVGPVSSAMGVSLEETTGVLALFAQQGIIGEQAGTSLRGMLTSLTSPSAQARTEIERLGLQIYDEQGNFLGLENAAGQLAGAYRGMDDASRDASLGIIFGRETITAATALYQAGAEGVAEWTASVDDSGYAAETAAMKLDNLKGDIEALQGSIETGLIETGAAANDVMRGMVQGATDLVNVYNDLPDPAQGAVLAVGGVTAAVGLAGGAALIAVPKVAEFWGALETLGLRGEAAKGKLGALTSFLGGPWGIALGVGVTAIALFGAEQARRSADVDAFTKTLDQQTGAVTDNTTELVTAALSAKDAFLWMQGQSTYDYAEQLGLGLDTVTEAALGNRDAIRELEAAYAAAFGEEGSASYIEDADTAEAWDRLWESIERQNGVVSDAKDRHDQLAEATKGTTEAAEGSVEGSELQAGGYQAVTDAAAGLEEQIDGLIEKILGQNDLNSTAIQRNAEWQAAIQNLTGALDSESRSLNQATVEGSANAAALSQIAQTGIDAALAQYEVDKTTMGAKAAAEKLTGTLADQRTKFEQAASAAGFNADEVKGLADQIFQVPDSKTINFYANTDNAKWTIDDFMADYGTRTGTINYRATLPDLNGEASGSGRMGSFATGGYTGPGGKWDAAGVVHRGEFVSTQETLAKPANRAALEYMHAGGDIRAFNARQWSSAPSSRAVAPVATAAPMPTTLEGNLYLDSGEFIGRVRGEIAADRKRAQLQFSNGLQP